MIWFYILFSASMIILAGRSGYNAGRHDALERRDEAVERKIGQWQHMYAESQKENNRLRTEVAKREFRLIYIGEELQKLYDRVETMPTKPEATTPTARKAEESA
jgi:hypothetical protein